MSRERGFGRSFEPGSGANQDFRAIQSPELAESEPGQRFDSEARSSGGRPSAEELEERIRRSMEQRRARSFHWTQPEVAWPLALFPTFLAGLAATAAGLAPIGPLVFAVVLTLLSGSLKTKGLAGTAAFACGAGTIGFSLGVAGAFVVAGASSSPLEALRITDQLFGAVSGEGWRLPEPFRISLFLGLAAVAVWVLGGRLAGLPALAVVGLVSGEIGAAAGRFASLLRTQQPGAYGEFAAVGLGLGPFHLLELAGLACILGGRGGRTLWASPELAERLRLTSFVGAALVLASLALRLTLGPGWQDQLIGLLD